MAITAKPEIHPREGNRTAAAPVSDGPGGDAVGVLPNGGEAVEEGLVAEEDGGLALGEVPEEAGDGDAAGGETGDGVCALVGDGVGGLTGVETGLEPFTGAGDGVGGVDDRRWNRGRLLRGDGRRGGRSLRRDGSHENQRHETDQRYSGHLRRQKETKIGKARERAILGFSYTKTRTEGTIYRRRKAVRKVNSLKVGGVFESSVLRLKAEVAAQYLGPWRPVILGCFGRGTKASRFDS
ncbi:hypothetical protein HPP92_013112 [Vanilla planifolia]|uniref:Uncharacterized protein n=1 Tax=Vanilla planifolia TaxID=51239 RepID=A0A835QMT0_VANPL|nr:hypothetical protein HPP92_013112 [Vanilla planifolia]